MVARTEVHSHMSTDDRDVTAISGIAETRADALADVGFETVGDVRAADESALTDATGIGESRADDLKTTVEEMENGTDSLSDTDGDESDGTDTDEHERATVQFSPDTDSQTDDASADTADGDGSETDHSGRIGGLKEKVASAFTGPQVSADESDLTHITTVRSQKATALRQAGFETMGDMAGATPSALADVEGVDDTNAEHIQRAAAGMLDGYSPASAVSSNPDEDVPEVKADDAETTAKVEAASEGDPESETALTPTTADEQNESASGTTTDDGNGGRSVATKSVEAVKTAGRAVINPASVIQDEGASTASGSGDAANGQQVSEDAIAEIADAADVSPSQARNLLQNAAEDDDVALTTDGTVASTNGTAASSDLTETYDADLIAPASLRLSPSDARTSDVYTKVIYIEGYPEHARPQMFERLFAEADHVDVDTSIHIGSHDRLDAIGHIQDAMEDLEVIVAQKEDDSDVTVRDILTAEYS
jgi:hypothetical protein